MPMNFNVDPYFDDYDPKKGFHKILFKPGVAVQARELTAIQSILQNQVTQFANHIFKDGSVVSGAEHFYDTNITYIKVKTDPTIDLTTLTDLTVKVNSNDNTKPDNRQFSIKHAVVADTNDPATLFVSFLDGGDTKSSNKYVSKNTTLDIYDDNILLYTLETADVDNCSGNSILFHINEGVFYTKNSFVFCPMQTIVVSKYNDVTYTGTVSASNNSKIVTGLNTTFTSSVKIGDDIFIGEFSYGLVASIESDTSLTLETESTKTVTGSSYRIALSKVIGLIPHENIITSDDDYSLLDPSYGSYNYAAPGADRYVILLEAVTKTYQDKLASSQDFIDLIHVKDGTITIDNRIPVYSTIMDSIARRTYDESGNYIVDGLLPHLEDSVNDSKLIISLSSGKAYVKGFELEKNGTTFIEVDKSRAFDSETIIVPTQYGNYITVSNFNGRLPNVSTSSTINLLNVNNVVIGTAKVVSLDVITFGTFKFYLDDIVMTKDIFSKVTSIKETSTITPTPANLYSATVTKSTIIDSSKRLLVFPVDRGNIKSINSIESITKKIYGPLNVSGGICSISTDSQYKDFSLASGSLLNNDFIVSVESSSSTNFPVGQIIDLSNMTVTVSNPYNSASSAVFDFGDSTFSGTVDIVATIFETGNLYRTKTLVENYGKEVTVSKSNVVKLGRADLYKLKAVTSIPKASDNYLGTYDSNANYPNGSIVYNNDGLYYIVSNAIGDKIPDESSDYIVNDGQTDSYYSHATIKKRKNATTDVTVLVVFDYFTHSGTGPLTVESYNSTGLNYSKLPTFVDSLAYTTYKLRNCLDYRPRQQDDSDIFDTYYFPSTSSTIVDTTFYLSRIDKLFLDKNGDFSVAQGKYAYTNVTTPANVPDAMEICSLTYEPYTDNKSNVSIQMFKNKRYTMRDIGLLESRLENVEYYTSLSALEKEASSKTFTSDNGTALFTNGFIVDSFKGKNVMDMSNPDNKCEVDFEANELRPKFEVITATLTNAGTEPTNGKTTIAIHPNTITLPYSSVELFKQTAASTAVSVNPFSIANTTGTLILTPDVDSWVYSSDTVDTPEAQQLLLGNDTTQTTQVTVWNSWKPGDATADLLSSVTNTEDFTNINAQQNKVIQGQTYSVIKLIKGSTRHNVVVAKVTGMLANATLYYFFENKLQENGWADTNGNSISTNPSSDDMGEWTGNIIIPEGYVGSTFNVMFTTSPAGKQFSNSTANSLYSIGYSLKYKDGQPLTSISSDTTGVQLPSTVIKKPKPNAVYSITPSSFTMREGQDITFTFDVQNGDPNVNYTGSCEVTGGTISSYTTKTVNGVAIGSMSNFTFRTINNKATIVIKAADDGIFQPERTFKLTVTVGHNKTPEELWPEYAYGSSYSETVKLLNPIQVQYAVTGPISVAANDTIRVNFSSINAEVNKHIKLSIKETLGDNTPTTYPFDLTSFDTNISSPSQDIILPITENSFLERDGSYKFTFTDDSVPSVSKDISVRVVGKYSTKYFKVFTTGDHSQHFISGQQVSFNLDTNYFNSTVNANANIPYKILVDIGNTGTFVNISTLPSKFTVSSTTGYFTKTQKIVVVTATGIFDSDCTIKMDLTDATKGAGESVTVYLDSNKEDFTLTGKKNSDTALITELTALNDTDVIHFTLTSSLPSTYSNKTVTAKLAVTNLLSNEYTLPSSVAFDSNGVATFDLVIKGNRGTLVSKPFNVISTIKNTKVSSVTLTLGNSVKATNAVSFVNDSSAAIETLTTTIGTPGHVKFILSQTGLLSTDKLDWRIQALNANGEIVNTNVFATGSILSGTVLVGSLTTVNPIQINLANIVPDNISIVAYVSQKSNKLNVTDETSDILIVNGNTPTMKITTDKVSISTNPLNGTNTVVYSIKSLYSSATARSCTWTLLTQNSSSLSNYSSSALSGSFTLASDGAPQTVTFIRNQIESEIDLNLVLTVTDNSGTPITTNNTNSSVKLSKIEQQQLSITYTDTSGKPLNSIYSTDPTKQVQPINVIITSPNTNATSTLDYQITIPGYDIVQSETNTNKLTQPVMFYSQTFNSGKITQPLFIVPTKNANSLQNTIKTTASKIVINSANVQLDVAGTLDVVPGKLPPKPFIAISKDINGKDITSTTLSESTKQTFYISNNINANATYLKVSFVTSLKTQLNTNDIIITGNTATTALTTIKKPAIITDDANETSFYYTLPNITASFDIAVKPTINSAVNEIFDVKIIKVDALNTVTPSNTLNVTINDKTNPMYTVTGDGKSIKINETTDLIFTPTNFSTTDVHTLTFTLGSLVLGTNFSLKLNGTPITTLSPITPTISLIGNMPITLSITAITPLDGNIAIKVASGAYFGNGSISLTNGEIIEFDVNTTKNIFENITYNVTVKCTNVSNLTAKVTSDSTGTTTVSGIVYNQIINSTPTIKTADGNGRISLTKPTAPGTITFSYNLPTTFTSTDNTPAYIFVNNKSFPINVSNYYPVISYSEKTFTEDDTIVGTIKNTITITSTNDKFVGINNSTLTGVTITGVPTGLTAKLTKISDYKATLQLTGTASNHAQSDSISNLTLTYNSTAFVNVTTPAAPVDTLSIEYIGGGPKLTFGSNSIFTESVSNDGSMNNKILITLSEANFTGTDGNVIPGVTFANVPADLTASVVRVSSTTAEFILTGNATAHQAINNVSNLTATFSNSSFTSGNATAIANYTKSDFKINYKDNPVVILPTFTLTNDHSEVGVPNNTDKKVKYTLNVNNTKTSESATVHVKSKTIKSILYSGETYSLIDDKTAVIHISNVFKSYPIIFTVVDNGQDLFDYTAELDVSVEFTNPAILPASQGANSSIAYFHYSIAPIYEISCLPGNSSKFSPIVVSKSITEINEGRYFWIRVNCNNFAGTYLKYDSSIIQTFKSPSEANFDNVVKYDEIFAKNNPGWINIPFYKDTQYIAVLSIDNNKWEDKNHTASFSLHADTKTDAIANATLIIKEATSPATISVTTKDTEIFEGSFSSTGILTGSVINYDITTTYLDKGTIIPIDWTSGASNVKQVTVTSDGGVEGDLFNWDTGSTSITSAIILDTDDVWLNSNSDAFKYVIEYNGFYYGETIFQLPFATSERIFIKIKDDNSYLTAKDEVLLTNTYTILDNFDFIKNETAYDYAFGKNMHTMYQSAITNSRTVKNGVMFRVGKSGTQNYNDKQFIIRNVSGDNKTFHATAKITLNADSKATNAGNVVFQVKGTNVTVPINMTPESKGLSLAATSNVKDVIGKNIVITITDDTVLQNADGYRGVIMENSTYARQFKITLNDTSISSLTFYTWTNNTNLTLEQSIKIGYDYTAKYHYSDYNTGPLMTLPNPTTGQTITVPVNGNNEFYIWVSSVYFTGNSGHVVNLKCTTTSITSNDAHVSFDITSVQASGSFYDPVAQTFYINPTDYPDGLFISKADLYFYSKPPQANIPVWIEIRPTVNGYPDSTTRISNSHVSLNQPLVNVPTSLTGTTIEPLPTTFTFTDPVYLPPGESSIIIGSTSKEYKVFVGELGQKDVTTGKLISENNPDNSVGSFFMSQNARTWTADQMKDLMFKLYRSDFDTSTELEVILDMKPETVNFTADLFHLNVPSKTFKDTSAKYAVSVTGNNIDYIDITSDNNVKLPVNTTPASTIKVKALLKSANSLLSPIIQKTMNMKLIRNLINNKSDLINLETIYSGGDADAKYITKKVTLATGFDAKGLRVLLDVNRVLGTSIEVYVKVIANEDYSDFNSKAFIQVPLKGALSYSKNDNDFVIDEYNLDNITYSTGDVNYDSFKSFIVKVVMYSDNTVNVPRVKNLRAIATS